MGIAKIIRPGNNSCIGIWKIEETTEELHGKLQFNDKEKEILKAMKLKKRYLHWLASRVMLRKLLNTNDFIELSSDDKGKPLLLNFPHKLSISHSDQMATVMISEDHEVGIDIQRIEEKIKVVSSRFMSESELEQIHPENETASLIICWCAKEALYKWYARGGIQFKEHLKLKLGHLTDNGTLAGTVISPEGTFQLSVNYLRIEEYFVAWVEGEANPKVVVR